MTTKQQKKPRTIYKADYKGAKPGTLAKELHELLKDKTPGDVVRQMTRPQPKGDGSLVKYSM